MALSNLVLTVKAEKRWYFYILLAGCFVCVSFATIFFNEAKSGLFAYKAGKFLAKHGVKLKAVGDVKCYKKSD